MFSSPTFSCHFYVVDYAQYEVKLVLGVVSPSVVSLLSLYCSLQLSSGASWLYARPLGSRIQGEQDKIFKRVDLFLEEPDGHNSREI